MQSNLKFNRHIASKVNSAKKVFICIKYALNDAPQPAQLLAYSSLCRSILEYADVLGNTRTQAVQNSAIRFVKSINGQHGITEGRTAIGLQELKDRRKSHRFALMTKIFQRMKNTVLFSAYGEIVNGRNPMSLRTRAAVKGVPTSVYAKSHAYLL